MSNLASLARVSSLGMSALGKLLALAPVVVVVGLVLYKLAALADALQLGR